jgi:hypothetical protein
LFVAPGIHDVIHYIRYFLIAESHGGHGALNFLPLTTIGPLNPILAREYSLFSVSQLIHPKWN